MDRGNACKQVIKLSPNEVEEILRNEQKKWRNFRLKQVRAQSKAEAARLLEAARNEEEKYKQIIRKNVEAEWEQQRQEKLNFLEQEYARCLREYGEAHRNAEVENVAFEELRRRRLKDARIALERGKNALKVMDKRKIESEVREREAKMKRERGLQNEKRRAQSVAQMPTPPRFKPPKKSPVKPIKKVTFHEAGTFITSSYVPSTLKVIKEASKDGPSASEAAKEECERRKQEEELRILKEKETRQKIKEREKIALNKERTKKLYTEIISDLQQAEAAHQLPDFLQWDRESSEDLEKEVVDAGEESEREREAEARVRELLKQEYQAAKLTGPTEKHQSPALQSTSPLRDHRLQMERSNEDSSNGHPAAEARDDHIDAHPISTQPLPRPDDIHFQETVPVHMLPILKDKFAVETIPEEVTSSVEATEASNGDSSFEQIRIKIDINKPPSSSDTVSQSVKSSSIEVNTQYPQYRYLKRKLDENKKRKSRNEVKISDISKTDSTGSSEHPSAPESVSADADKENVWKDIKQIQKGRKNIQSMIDKFKQIQNEIKPKELDKNKRHFFKTPPRMYTQPLKPDGSGEKLLTKKEKFGKHKKFLVQHYMQRLVQMRKEELKQLPVSSVHSSGIDITPDTHVKELRKLLERASSGVLSLGDTTNGQHTINDKYSDIDTVPTKMSSSGTLLTESNDASTTTSGGGTVGLSELYRCSSKERENLFRQQIQEKVQQLTQLREHILQTQEEVFTEPQDEGDLNMKMATLCQAVGGRREEESSLDWSAQSQYQTPSRENDSSLSGSVWPSLSRSRDVPHQAIPDEVRMPHHFTSDVLANTRHFLGEVGTIGQYTAGELRSGRHTAQGDVRSPETVQKESYIPVTDDSRITEQSSIEEVDARVSSQPTRHGTELLSNALQHRRSVGSNSNGDAETGAISSNFREKKFSERESSSSVTSMPDMVPILQNFGLGSLGWARSMIKKMDDVEENASTDSSKA